MSENHKIVSHDADLDGVASAILLSYYIKSKFNSEPTICFADYENVNEIVSQAAEDATHLWISDLSIRNLDLVEVLAKFNSDTLHFFDHHVDSREFVNAIQNNATVFFESTGEKCAADLIWDYISQFLHSDEFLHRKHKVNYLEYLVKATHSRDLWVNDVQEGAELTAVIAMLGPDKTYQHLIEDLSRVKSANFTDLMNFCVHISEDNIVQAKNLARASMMKYFYLPNNPKSKVAGVSVVVAFTTGCQSDVGHMFLTEIPRAMVGLINLSNLTISFRTTQDVISQIGFGVNAIASTIEGGGGHTYAAGASLSNDILVQGPKALLKLMLDIIDEKAFEKDGIKTR